MTKAKREQIPAGYRAVIEQMIQLIPQWCGEQPGLPDLRWHDNDDGVLVIAALQGDALKYLAKTPDAIRLLQWLDEKTDHKATLLQARVALQMLGHLPGGPELEVKHQSAAMRAISALANNTTTDTRIGVSPCPTCGKGLDAASSAKGHTPRPGDASVCIYCSTALVFAEDLTLRAMTDDELEALPTEVRNQIQETGDLFRAARTGALKKKRSPVQA
jgi:hypothetical protein